MRRRVFPVIFIRLQGQQVAFEMWAFPEKDDNVRAIHSQYKDQFENPKSLKDFTPSDDYVAVFIPGGHGALNGLPFNEDVKKVLKWAVEKDKFIFSLCHGPAVLLALAEGSSESEFPLASYKINAFPDNMDKKVPEIGYTPGECPISLAISLKLSAWKF